MRLYGLIVIPLWTVSTWIVITQTSTTPLLHEIHKTMFETSLADCRNYRLAHAIVCLTTHTDWREGISVCQTRCHRMTPLTCVLRARWYLRRRFHVSQSHLSCNSLPNCSRCLRESNHFTSDFLSPRQRVVFENHVTRLFCSTRHLARSRNATRMPKEATTVFPLQSASETGRHRGCAQHVLRLRLQQSWQDRRTETGLVWRNRWDRLGIWFGVSLRLKRWM